VTMIDMKFIAKISTLVLLFSPEIYAAKCKVDGVWYPYDSPQCQPFKYENLKKTNAPQQDKTSVPQNHSQSRKTQESLVPSFLRPWNEVSGQASDRCDATHTNKSLKDACYRNEKRGYWSMHEDFEIPPDVASLSKIRCSAQHENFSLQAACMRNETRGYEAWTGPPQMPGKYQREAKSRCALRHESYSLLAACMRNEHRAFKKQYGFQSTD